MGKKRELRRLMRKRRAEGAPALVICVGKRCCPRSQSRALVEASRLYAAARHPSVAVQTVGCLTICKQGPIAAMYPALKFKKRVDRARARKLIDKLEV